MDIRDALERCIRTVPDFPIPGIQFRDITPVLADPALMKRIAESFAESVAETKPTAVAGPEARGFIFGPLVAAQLGCPFIPIRKPGKLPSDTVSVAYELEYGTNTLEMHKDALVDEDRVIIVDDLLATGGTVQATISLIEGTGAQTVGTCFVIELLGLNGRGKIEPIPVHSLIALPA